MNILVTSYSSDFHKLLLYYSMCQFMPFTFSLQVEFATAARHVINKIKREQECTASAPSFLSTAPGIEIPMKRRDMLCNPMKGGIFSGADSAYHHLEARADQIASIRPTPFIRLCAYRISVQYLGVTVNLYEFLGLRADVLGTENRIQILMLEMSWGITCS